MGTTSLGKALSILDIVVGHRAPLSVRALGAATGLPSSTVHRLASELCEWGALDRDRRGYRLGLRLFEIGGAVPSQLELRVRARPFMEDLHEATGRLAQLGVLDGCDVIYVARVGRRGSQPVATEIPGRVPASCSALGKALLAFDRAATQRVLASGLTARTPYSIVTPALLRTHLADVRRSGFAIEREETRLGLVCVAAPILGTGGTPEAAISLTGPIGSFEPQHAAGAVRAAALGIARALTVTQE